MRNDMPSREEMVDIVDEYRDSALTHERRSELALQLASWFPVEDVLNLCESDLSAGEIIDACLGFASTQRLLSRDELVALIQDLLECKFTTEVAEMLAMEIFLFNCIHPAGRDLINDPEAVLGEGCPISSEIIADMARQG